MTKWTEAVVDCRGIIEMKFLGLTLGLALASGALAQNFGPAVVDRSTVDLAHQITFISGVHASPTSGEISEWRLWAGGTGDVALQMWRPVTGGFELVGQNFVTVTTLGLNTIAINSGRIQVQAGDVIGFRYNQTTLATRVIDFDAVTVLRSNRIDDDQLLLV